MGPSATPIDALAAAGTATGASLAVLAALAAASVAVWVVIVVKLRELGRWARAERMLQRMVGDCPSEHEVRLAISRHGATFGAAVLQSLLDHRERPDLREPIIERALSRVRRRAGTGMTLLATIGSAAPFVGLLGTVWGILEAFLRIGEAHSVTLAVVAPAIGEALLATAVGLLAAIPAVVGYNFLSRRVDQLVDDIGATARIWARGLERE